MANETYRNIRLGAFVAVGTVLMVVAFYLIGNKQNLFGSSFRISARFYNVNGLTQGNNVRFAGIDVGTVETVEIINDSTVIVTMLLEKDVQKFIKGNAIASVGTDGLMGNKLVNINSVKDPGLAIKEGDELGTLRPLEMDEMVRTLNETNINIKVITDNLRSITEKISSKNSLWNVLLDTLVADNVKSVVVNLKLMSNDGIAITGNFKELSAQMRSGKGTIAALVTDTVLSGRVNQTIVNLEKFSDSAAVISGDISFLVHQLKHGKGTLGILLTDTMLVHDLNKSILRIDTAAGSFDENMEALHYSWPFKKYYKKQGKK